MYGAARDIMMAIKKNYERLVVLLMQSSIFEAL